MGLVWIAAVVAVFVFVDILAVELRRIRREVRTIQRRVAAYRELPIFSLLAATPGDVSRANAALTRIPGLLARADAALRALRLPADGAIVTILRQARDDGMGSRR